jgi:hypothetical protein
LEYCNRAPDFQPKKSTFPDFMHLFNELTWPDQPGRFAGGCPKVKMIDRYRRANTSAFSGGHESGDISGGPGGAYPPPNPGCGPGRRYCWCIDIPWTVSVSSTAPARPGPRNLCPIRRTYTSYIIDYSILDINQRLRMDLRVVASTLWSNNPCRASIAPIGTPACKKFFGCSFFACIRCACN